MPRKDKRGSRAYLDTTEEGVRVQRDRGAAAREAAQKKAEEAFLEKERAKKARFDTLTSVSELSKSEFRSMRMQPFFDMPQNSSNPFFWRREQEIVMNDIYAKLSGPNIVCVQKVLNLSALGTKPYFQEAIWIVRKLGLEHLMTLKQNYDIKLVHQFFATVQFGEDEDVSLTWMTGPIKCESSMTRFGELLGYVFRKGETSQGRIMHTEGVQYDKGKMAPLYLNKSSIGSNRDLLPTFNILLRMFRCNIAPQAGNVDAIRGGLVNLLCHSNAVLQAGVNCQGYEIDVMDFIKCELHWAVHEMKNPIYAPYVMKLLIDQVPNLNHEHFTVHKAGSLQVLKHDKPSSSSAPSRVPFASSEEEEEDVAPVRKRSKNADPPHGLARARMMWQRR